MAGHIPPVMPEGNIVFDRPHIIRDGDVFTAMGWQRLFWVIKTDYNGDCIWETTFGVEPPVRQP